MHDGELAALLLSVKYGLLKKKLKVQNEEMCSKLEKAFLLVLDQCILQSPTEKVSV